MADETSVQTARRQEIVQGQAQAPVQAPDDGKHFVDEVRVHTDKVILDVTDPLAVQVPEGVGASTAGHYSPMGEALGRGTPEEQLSAGDKEQVAPEETATETSAPDVSGTAEAPAADAPAAS